MLVLRVKHVACQRKISDRWLISDQKWLRYEVLINYIQISINTIFQKRENSGIGGFLLKRFHKTVARQITGELVIIEQYPA